MVFVWIAVSRRRRKLFGLEEERLLLQEKMEKEKRERVDRGDKVSHRR